MESYFSNSVSNVTHLNGNLEKRLLNLFDMLFVCTFPGQFHFPVVTFHYEIFNRMVKNIRLTVPHSA